MSMEYARRFLAAAEYDRDLAYRFEAAWDEAEQQRTLLDAGFLCTSDEVELARCEPVGRRV